MYSVLPISALKHQINRKHYVQTEARVVQPNPPYRIVPALGAGMHPTRSLSPNCQIFVPPLLPAGPILGVNGTPHGVNVQR